MARSELQDPNLQNARARLATLREKKPPTKAAQIRALWPDIKAALDAGHGLKSVCECLEADGINITVPALGSYMTRMRRKSPPPVAMRPNDPGKLAETAEPNRENSILSAREHSRTARKAARIRLPAAIGRP